jgi:hypothetical protein
MGFYQGIYDNLVKKLYKAKAYKTTFSRDELNMLIKIIEEK